MSEPGALGDDPLLSDGASTINEAGASGFAVDGTDSFAVPGLPDATDPEDPAGAVVPAFRSMIVTIGAAIIGLVIVIIIGSSGRDGSANSVRSVDEPPPFTLPSLFGGDGQDSGVPADDGTEGTLDVRDFDDEDIDITASSRTIDPYQYDDEAFPSVPSTSDPYGEFTYDTLALPDYSPYVPTPRRIIPSVIPSRPRVTFPRVIPPPPAVPTATSTTSTTTTSLTETTAAATTTDATTTTAATTTDATTTTAAATTADATTPTAAATTTDATTTTAAATTTAPCQTTTTVAATAPTAPGTPTTETTAVPATTAATTTTTTTMTTPPSTSSGTGSTTELATTTTLALCAS